VDDALRLVVVMKSAARRSPQKRAKNEIMTFLPPRRLTFESLCESETSVGTHLFKNKKLLAL
jgi:hypothetical protein